MGLICKAKIALSDPLLLRKANSFSSALEKGWVSVEETWAWVASIPQSYLSHVPVLKEHLVVTVSIQRCLFTSCKLAGSSWLVCSADKLNATMLRGPCFFFNKHPMEWKWTAECCRRQVTPPVNLEI